MDRVAVPITGNNGGEMRLYNNVRFHNLIICQNLSNTKGFEVGLTKTKRKYMEYGANPRGLMQNQQQSLFNTAGKSK